MSVLESVFISWRVRETDLKTKDGEREIERKRKEEERKSKKQRK
jgi:hypothetical protein